MGQIWRAPPSFFPQFILDLENSVCFPWKCESYLPCHFLKNADVLMKTCDKIKGNKY